MNENFRNTHHLLLYVFTYLDSKVRRAHLWPTGPKRAPCWPHELCYLGMHPIDTTNRATKSLYVSCTSERAHKDKSANHLPTPWHKHVKWHAITHRKWRASRVGEDHISERHFMRFGLSRHIMLLDNSSTVILKSIMRLSKWSKVSQLRSKHIYRCRQHSGCWLLIGVE